MTCVGRGRSGGAGIVVGVTQVGFGAVSFIDHQIDGHFAFQTADVTVAKVVAQFVHLSNKRKRKKRKRQNVINLKSIPLSIRRLKRVNSLSIFRNLSNDAAINDS